MQKRLLLPVLLVLVFLLSTGACKDKKKTPFFPISLTVTPLDNPTLPSRGYFMGMLPNPATGSDYDISTTLAAQYCDWTPIWGTPSPFWEMATDIGGGWGDIFVDQFCRAKGMFPLMHLSFMDAGMMLALPPELASATLELPAWRTAYKAAAIAVVKAGRPKYFSVGNEVNRWFETYGTDPGNSNGFQHFVSLYEEVYDEVKALSPDTQVFCTFAREIVDNNSEADVLTVLNMFNSDKMDMVMLTTYPYALAGVNNVSDLANDYYSSVIPAAFQSKPFGFSEACWTSLAPFGGEQGQADFINEVVTRLTVDQSLYFQFFGWPWLHNLDDVVGAGLIMKDGTEKLGWLAWQALAGS
ncbi:MAG: hypothetical protein E3J72_03010 [Planctomycetota bacterium]|nr:MAG: hypothetical protein E3J72_03010 [Planctomycetota bacterium]